MKRFISYLLSLFTLLSLLSAAIPVWAEPGEVTFIGIDEGFSFAPGSTFSETDLFGGFKGVMPGDVLTENITVTNSSSDSDYIKLYLRANSIDGEPLSDAAAQAGEDAVSMMDFLSQLSLTVWAGSTESEPIYKATPDLTDGLTEPVFLGELRQGDTVELIAELTVPTELDNKYANRYGEVSWSFIAELFDDPLPPPPDDAMITVNLVWKNDTEDTRPDSVKVDLIRDGAVYDTVDIGPDDAWTYTWYDLDPDASWTVELSEDVPSYSHTSSTEGCVVTIVLEPEAVIPPTEDITVNIVWENDTEDTRPDSVKVDLICDGTVYDTVDIGPDDAWTYTWEGLDPDHTWSVQLNGEIPGYVPEMSVDGNVVTLTMTYVPPVIPVSLTAVKAWSGDEKEEGKRPDSASLTLYNGTEAVETVVVGAWNNWTYTWDGLDPAGDWKVLETDIPKEYAPVYSADGDTVTVTNTLRLPQTGQDKWTVPVFAGAGILLIGVGLFIILAKRRRSDEA